MNPGCFSLRNVKDLLAESEINVRKGDHVPELEATVRRDPAIEESLSGHTSPNPRT
jgi:hypothetical protein